jgi:hypothetical protein
VRKTYAQLLCLVSFFFACTGHQNPPKTVDSQTQPLTVCQLFADLPSYQDKVITVKGIFFYGLRQPNCPQAFVTGDHKWPSVINWVNSNYPADEYERPVEFVTDEDSWNKLELLTLTEGRKGRREEIWVTAEGRLRGPQRYLRPGVKGGMGGYGHLGVLPAELIVKRVIKIEIEPTPTYDYRCRCARISEI